MVPLPRSRSPRKVYALDVTPINRAGSVGEAHKATTVRPTGSIAVVGLEGKVV